jgi:hypothetical protein
MDQDSSSPINWRNSIALKKREFRVADDDGHLLSYWVPRERERELCPHWNFLLSIKPDTLVVWLSDSWTLPFLDMRVSSFNPCWAVLWFC